jgi:NADH-quinone oxidoreductase subunit C
MSDLIKENEILEQIKKAFQIEGKVSSERRTDVFADKTQVSSILLLAKNQYGFKHLNHIACVDWIEDNQFELVYILYNHQTGVTLSIHTKIDRENPEMENIDTIWDQANTYEREMREMYGIEFPGLVGEKEFILEDWEDTPPMRRDFNTLDYATNTYFHQAGREDAQDVRTTISTRSGEEIPDFAKKYSRDK